MNSNFDRCLEFVLRWEGGAKVTRDPHDPGGTTKYGISQRAYPSLDIESLTREDAARIYRRDYWDRMQCDTLRWPLDLVAFDTAVNQGVAFARRALKFSQVAGTIIEYRLARYRALKAWPRYGKGWTNRLRDLSRECGIPWEPEAA